MQYWNDLGTSIDASRTSTAASGRLSAVNLEGESVTLTVDGPGTCSPRERYWSADPNQAVLPLRPGFFSGVTLNCE